MMDGLRATVPIDPDRSVMVAGDPEYAREADRLARGIPLSAKLAAQLEDICKRAGAAFLLEPESLTT